MADEKTVAEDENKAQEKKVSKATQDSQDAAAKFREVLKDGVKDKKQAAKLLAVSDVRIPEVGEDQDPLKWCYMTFDGNVFFVKKAALKHAFKLSGGNASIPQGKIYSVELRQ